MGKILRSNKGYADEILVFIIGVIVLTACAMFVFYKDEKETYKEKAVIYEAFPKSVSAKLDADLYKEIQIIAATQGRNTNDLLEEGMRMVREKYAGNQVIIPKLKTQEPDSSLKEELM